MLSKQQLSNGDYLWRTERGEAQVHLPAPNVVVVTVRGHSTMELFPLFVQEPDRCMALGLPVHWFADYTEMQGYDTETRMALSDYTNAHRDEIEQLAVLVRSPLVAMGIGVANLAVGGRLRAFTDRRKFDALIHEAVERSATAQVPLDAGRHG